MVGGTLDGGWGSVALEVGGKMLTVLKLNGRVLKVNGRWSVSLGIFFGRPGPRLCSGAGSVVGHAVSSALLVVGCLMWR